VLPAVLLFAALFVLLLAGRIGGAKRADWLPRWPAIVFAGAAIFALFKAAITPAIMLGALAVLSWFFWPLLAKRPAAVLRPDVEEVEAQAILGVAPNATDAEIRAAYRARMRQAHPDQGGSHADAARLTAARDRLLARRRRG
jgi:hypothetical protein